jgi:gamma-glutamyltranspeptidase
MALTIQRLPARYRTIVTWAAETTAANSSIKPYEPETSMAVSSIQVAGTFGSATVTFLGSNDGTTYTAIKDNLGNAISVTAAGQFELSTAYRYFKPSISGGTGDSLNVYLLHWG